jgi:hypothetical protein
VATVFGVDLDAASLLASDRRSVRADLAAVGQVTAEAGAVTGSAKLGAALEGFVKHTSDQRAALSTLLDRAEGLLDALVDGTQEVDGSLASALPTPAAIARQAGTTPDRTVGP